MKTIYEYNTENIYSSSREEANDYVIVAGETELKPSDSLFKAKFENGAWIEGGTSDQAKEHITEKAISGQPILTTNAIVSASESNGVILGGSRTQPNLVGIETHVQHHTGDGTTDTYDITAPFVINELDRHNLKYIIKRDSDDAILTGHVASTLTVNSGYGTNTVNVTIGNIPSVDDLLEFVVYGENDDPAAVPTLDVTTGYDNSVSAIASIAMSNHSIIFPGNGHNILTGGSYLRSWGSFNTSYGSGNWIGRKDNSSIGCVAFGRGLEVDGIGAGTIGLNNKVEGTTSFWFGRDSIIDEKNDTVGFGRKGDALFNSSLVLSGGRSTDTSTGQHQFHKVVMNRETTDASEQFMRDATGATTLTLLNQTAYTVSVSVVGFKDDYTKSESFAGVYNLVKDPAGTARINGSSGDVNVPSVGGFGSPSYNVDIRGNGGKLGIRVTGEAGENVRWTATLDITQTKY